MWKLHKQVNSHCTSPCLSIWRQGTSKLVLKIILHLKELHHLYSRCCFLQVHSFFFSLTKVSKLRYKHIFLNNDSIIVLRCQQTIFTSEFRKCQRRRRILYYWNFYERRQVRHQCIIFFHGGLRLAGIISNTNDDNVIANYIIKLRRSCTHMIKAHTEFTDFLTE